MRDSQNGALSATFWASATAAKVVSTLLLLLRRLLFLQIPSKETKAKLKGKAAPIPPNVYT